MLCECGCGQQTSMITKSNQTRGLVKGQAHRFLHHHSLKGAQSPYWKGGKYRQSQGYIWLSIREHPRAGMRGRVYEHIVIAEKVLGKSLPANAQVHHVNERRADNRNINLVICEDQTYHCLIHRRAEAYRATGNPKSRLCVRCKGWGEPGIGDFIVRKRSNGYDGFVGHYHCERENRRAYQHSRKKENLL
jgi:hypothetical protein